MSSDAQDVVEVLEVQSTELTADATEWCPCEEGHGYCAVGLYQLRDNPDAKEGDDTPKLRVGQIQLYHLADEQQTHVELQQRVESAAILDMKWAGDKSGCASPTLATVTASGHLDLYSLNPEEASLTKENSIAVVDNELALSLDWDDRVSIGAVRHIAVSGQDGRVSKISVGENGSAEVVMSWKAHDFPAWICAFDYWNPNIVFSGGDDCKFKSWDTRTDCSYAATTSKAHEMGVTSMQSNPFREHVLVTGSYDENVRVWDTRALRRPVYECAVGGGLWRLKWHPSDPSLILCAGMYSGFHVLEDDGSALAVRCTYDVDGKLAYGASWCRKPLLPSTDEEEQEDIAGTQEQGERKRTSLVCSCTFYEAKMQLWRVHL